MTFYKPITDIKELKILFSDKQFDSGLTYGGYVAMEGDCSVGKILTAIDGYNSEILSISAQNDNLLTEGLIRAALNFAANRNAYISKCSLKEFEDVLKLLGYSYDNGVYSGEIPELLKGACCKGN